MIHGPPDFPYEYRCLGRAAYRLKDEDGEALLCTKHAKVLRDMYQPGQIRRLRSVLPIGIGSNEVPGGSK